MIILKIYLGLKDKMKKDKRGQGFTLKKLIILVLVVLVVLLVISGAYKLGILDFLKNLPGFD